MFTRLFFGLAYNVHQLSNAAGTPKQDGGARPRNIFSAGGGDASSVLLNMRLLVRGVYSTSVKHDQMQREDDNTDCFNSGAWAETPQTAQGENRRFCLFFCAPSGNKLSVLVKRRACGVYLYLLADCQFIFHISVPSGAKCMKQKCPRAAVGLFY